MWIPRKANVARKLRAAALSLRDHVGEAFHAVVSGTSRKATWLKIMPGEIEGRLVRGRRGLSVGRKLTFLLAVDPADSSTSRERHAASCRLSARKRIFLGIPAG